MTTRRRLLQGIAALPALLATRAAAQQKEIKVLLATPLSGGQATNGEYCLRGVELAIADANRAGGVHSLGNAMFKLIKVDCGDSPDRAKSAVQRVLASEEGIVVGIGSWASALTLATSEVSERERLPWIADGWSDVITSRGFKYVIDPSPLASRMTDTLVTTVLGLAEKASGKKIGKLAIIADNGATSQALLTPVRKTPQKYGLSLVADESFVFPMSDATPFVQKIRQSRPELIILSMTLLADAKLFIDKLNEFGLGGGKIPILTYGPQLGSVDTLKNIGAERLEGVMGCSSTWGSKKQVELLKRMRERTGEPWLTSDLLINYAYIMFAKDALERAGSTDRDKLMDAVLSTDTSTGPADYFLGDRLHFDKTGRRVDAPVALFQWQNGIPLTIAPEGDAQASIKWPTPA